MPEFILRHSRPPSPHVSKGCLIKPSPVSFHSPCNPQSKLITMSAYIKGAESKEVLMKRYSLVQGETTEPGRRVAWVRPRPDCARGGSASAMVVFAVRILSGIEALGAGDSQNRRKCSASVYQVIERAANCDGRH